MASAKVTAIDEQLQPLLVDFTAAVFLLDEPPEDINVFARDYFAKLWQEARKKPLAKGTWVMMRDPARMAKARKAQVMAVNRLSKTFDLRYEDNNERESQVKRSFCLECKPPRDVSLFLRKDPVALRKELDAKPPPTGTWNWTNLQSRNSCACLVAERGKIDCGYWQRGGNLLTSPHVSICCH